MSRINRRTFLKRSITTAGAAFAIASPFRRILGANETIRVGVAGIHGQGGSHIGAFQKMDGVDVTCLIDPDSALFEGRTKQIQDLGGGKPTCVQDVRRALEDKNLDAISIASCNHWHCLLTIWACQAGKDVYVEKPLSHDLHEGRIALETSRKHSRVVQYGTGSGSLGDGIAALVRKGTYGKLLVSRGLCYKRRKSIGFREPTDPPSALDFDIWNGPAPKQPYHGNLVHYNWHWFWDFGGGDIANQGSHQMHAALHAIPGVTFPRSAITVGGRFGYEDQGQTANTQISVYDFGETQLIFEVRGLETGNYFGQGIGNTFHFEEGVVAGGKFYRGGKGDPQPVEPAKAERVSRGGNFGEFIRCVRSRERDLLDWNLETAHYSAGLCHLGNISYRLGEEVAFGDRKKPFGDNAAANETFERMADHLKGNSLKLEETKYRVGRRLEFDARA
ncbi:MAG: Gfo/Idh/MocA family oxidoreductase, partial [Planctomycetes bacterium]|nr:Gfo/Idh/MocA family oxidoreductase [Planctomycetota bacterium]